MSKYGSTTWFSCGTFVISRINSATLHAAQRTMNGDVNTARRMPPDSVESDASPRRRQMLLGNAAARERRSSAGAGSGSTSIVSHGTAADHARHGANALSVRFWGLADQLERRLFSSFIAARHGRAAARCSSWLRLVPVGGLVLCQLTRDA